MSDENELQETAFYDGAENPIFYSRKFNLKLKCDFKLGYFPFDTQTCFITLNAGNKVKSFIKLIGETVYFIGERELATFYVVNWNLEAAPMDNDIDVQVNIFFKRQISQYVFGVYIPSLFIMVIAQVCLRIFFCPWLEKSR